MSRTERGECGGCRGALREPGSCPQGRRGLPPPPDLRETEAKSRAWERGGLGARRGREALREPPVLELPGPPTAVPRAAEHHGAGSGGAAPFSLVPQRCPGRPAGQTDRSAGNSVSGYGLFKDDAHPTDAA